MAKHKLRRLHSHHPHRHPRHIRKLIRYYALHPKKRARFLAGRDHLLTEVVGLKAGQLSAMVGFGPPQSHDQIVYWAVDSCLPSSPTHLDSRKMSEFALDDQAAMFDFLNSVRAAILQNPGYSVTWTHPAIEIQCAGGTLGALRAAVSKATKP